MGVIDHSKNLITEALRIIELEFDGGEDMSRDLQDKLNTCEEEKEELLGIRDELHDQLENINDENQRLHDEIDRYRRRNYILEETFRGLEIELDDTEETDRLLVELEELEGERNTLRDRVGELEEQIEGLEEEIDEQTTLYRAEQLLTRHYERRIIILKMTKRQLQIKLMNAPINPPPQLINQVWLLL